jgi:hypothetical protein
VVEAMGLEPTNLLTARRLEVVRSSVVKAGSGWSYQSAGPSIWGLVRSRRVS